MKKISLIGSTGSIGRQTVEVVLNNPDKFKIVALAANCSHGLFNKQLSALRLEGKTKTARFRELLGQKLILSAMTGRLRGCGALPMKEPAENSCNDLNGL